LGHVQTRRNNAGN
jgi:hypothetical protein